MQTLLSLLPTIIISLILIIVVAAIIIKLIKDKKNGKSSCGCNCDSCPLSGSCHKTDKK